MNIKRTRRQLWSVLIGVVLTIGVVVSACGWYVYMTRPLDTGASTQVVTITAGMTPSSIGRMLEDNGIIRNGFAFQVYVILHGVSGQLQAGRYTFGPAQSISAIVDALRQGNNEVRNVIILPGMTLKQLADPNTRNSFAVQGFSPEQISKAFNASYTSPVLADKPAERSIEGYIFPDTYQISAGDSLESLIQRAIDHMYSQLQTNDLINKFRKQGITIHEAVTLASIVQKEVSNSSDQRQVAQVLFKRLQQGMKLECDPTFVYAAELQGVKPTTTIDSPYNTRLYAGIPPGPIATMNVSALEAVAEPAAGDYLYFVAGDDGVTHFSRTKSEHQAATAKYCIRLCSMY